MTASNPATGVASDRLTARQVRTVILTASFGNLAEWFDFTTYGLLAATLGLHFFTVNESEGSVIPLMLAFATFGAGFVARPIGGFLLGRYGDRRGRKPALLLSITMMGVSTGSIAILPDQSTIGLAAPLLLTTARLVQGLAAGGEWGGAASFLVEWAPRNRRGTLGSCHTAMTSLGGVAGSLTVAGLTAALGADAMTEWGWRLPFAIGALLALVAIPVRLKAEETPVFRAEKERAKRERAGETAPEVVQRTPLDRGQLARRLLFTFCLVGMQSAAIYTFTSYFPAFVVQFTKNGSDPVGPSAALFANALASVVSVCTILVSGALSDRIGRKPGMLISCILVLVLSYPMISLALVANSFAVTVIVQCVLVACVALFLGCLPVTLVELFPARLRLAGLNTSYNTAAAVFGGFAPFIATAVVAATGRPPAAALWPMIAAVVSLIAVMLLKETRGADLS